MAVQKVPPHSDEAEKSVLGSILIDKDAIVQVSEFLQPDHFYQNKHSDIYAAMIKLFEAREPIDLVTLPQKLKSMKMLDAVGGVGYVSSLVEGVPSSANIKHYGEIIQGYYTRRRLIADSSSMIEMSFDEGSDIAGILDSAEQKVFSLSQSNLKQGFIPIRSVLSESFDRLDELSKKSGTLRGVPSGFTDLDNCLAGMQDSNLIILAARPGMGKTAFSLNIAQYASVVAKVPVGYFSLEMSKEELVDRMLVSQADIDAWRLKTGKLTPGDFEKLSEAMGVLAEAPLYIDDTPGMSILEMRTKARRLQAEHGLRLVIVDYLQLARPVRNLDNRVAEVSEVSQGLKNLARELKVPVLALSQLSRQVESRGIKKPQLADLRESGAIEQDADVVMFLWRENDEDLENMKLDIAKHRNGALRSINLRFRGDRIKFYSVEGKRRS